MNRKIHGIFASSYVLKLMLSLYSNIPFMSSLLAKQLYYLDPRQGEKIKGT